MWTVVKWPSLRRNVLQFSSLHIMLIGNWTTKIKHSILFFMIIPLKMHTCSVWSPYQINCSFTFIILHLAFEEDRIYWTTLLDPHHPKVLTWNFWFKFPTPPGYGQIPHSQLMVKFPGFARGDVEVSNRFTQKKHLHCRLTFECLSIIFFLQVWFWVSWAHIPISYHQKGC